MQKREKMIDFPSSEWPSMGSPIVQEERCLKTEQNLHPFSNTLNSFIKLEDNAYSVKLDWVKQDKDVTIYRYIVSSQFWPVEYAGDADHLWTHRLTIYKPSEVEQRSAVMYVNGGYNKNKKGLQEFSDSPEMLAFPELAAKHKALVVNLADVPNQFLFFKDDPQPKKEDEILAYTYKKVIDDPQKNAYLAGHLPMTKAIIKAMDAVQEIAKDSLSTQITDFILAGASKRGWAVWLAALEDNRVSNIIPAVIDILSVRKNLAHIHKIYGKYPFALKDYLHEEVIYLLESPQGIHLMNIEDPFSYLQPGYPEHYVQRLSLPKYIISASGDDFFAPDSSQFYFKSLPGNNNYIRYIPNASHSLLGKIGQSLKTDVIVSRDIDSYLSLIFKNSSLPKLDWEFSSTSITLHTSQVPHNVTLWSAHNPEKRDFRCLQLQEPQYLSIKPYLWLYFSAKWVHSWVSDKLCDTQYYPQEVSYSCISRAECVITIPLPKVQQGFQASFLEMQYDISGVLFTATTEINVTTSKQ